MKNNSFPHAYIRKKFCKTKDATISIQCKVVQYGLGCFTGMRGYYDKKSKNINLFRLDDHYKRLQESAKILQMTVPLNEKKFKETVIELIKKNKAKGDIYIRPTLYSGSTALTPRFNNPDDDLALYMISLDNYFSSDNGLSICVSSWRRYDDDALSVKAKITGAYANSALAKSEALQNGYDEALFLNRDGKVCEASGANLFRVKDGVITTPPLASNNLDGITRRTLIELIENELEMPVRESDMDRSMLYTSDEVFFCGTAAKVTWIRAVDNRKIGNGKEGKITKKIKAVFNQAISGELPDYHKWLTPVY